MKIEKLAIIGLGSIGRKHLELVKTIDSNIKVCAVRSGKSNHGNLKNNQEKLIDKIFISINDAIDYGIQTAIISTPSPFHVECALELFASDVNVLIEKPLSNDYSNVNEVIKVEKKSKAVGLIGYCFRHDSNGKFFKKMIEENKVGDILSSSIVCSSYLPNWRKEQDYSESVSAKKKLGGGVLLELSHELDYSRWLFGEFKSVFCQMNYSKTLKIETEDCVDMIIKTNNNIPLNIHLDYNTRNTNRMCIIRGTKGNLLWDIIGKKVLINYPNSSPKVIFSDSKQDIYHSQLVHFFNCVENRAKPLVTLDDGASTMKLIEASIKSNQSGKKIFLS